jgi:hypothetical protein
MTRQRRCLQRGCFFSIEQHWHLPVLVGVARGEVLTRNPRMSGRRGPMITPSAILGKVRALAEGWLTGMGSGSTVQSPDDLVGSNASVASPDGP